MPDINQEPSRPEEAYCGVLEPGNGSRYEYCVWRVGNQWFAAFPDFHAASRIGSGTHRSDYVSEKFRVSNPDAEVMAAIINRCIDAPATQGSIEQFISQVMNG